MGYMSEDEQFDVSDVGLPYLWRHGPFSMVYISKVAQDIEKVRRLFNTNMGWNS